ncbi:Amastin surface glycoprotein [Trypanosoma melophagium]|uniref:Amastin surface glycoprotein n=1 Tax=Trypanosoma melophagium TaxID=715481 RepID=UPI00351A8008|nr:Amastin surface glycoprotein [Trypanosoma melophagium]
MNFGVGLIPLVIECVVFLFVLIGTPLETFRLHNPLGSDSCITLWGARNCGSASYSSRDFRCNREKSTMNAGAAFAIISIFVTLVAILTFFLTGKLSPAGLIGKICAILAVFTILIAWATPASVFHQHMCKMLSIRLHSYKENGWHLAAGFGLMVTAWCLQIIAVVLSFVL